MQDITNPLPLNAQQFAAELEVKTEDGAIVEKPSYKQTLTLITFLAELSKTLRKDATAVVADALSFFVAWGISQATANESATHEGEAHAVTFRNVAGIIGETVSGMIAACGKGIKAKALKGNQWLYSERIGEAFDGTATSESATIRYKTAANGHSNNGKTVEFGTLLFGLGKALHLVGNDECYSSHDEASQLLRVGELVQKIVVLTGCTQEQALTLAHSSALGYRAQIAADKVDALKAGLEALRKSESQAQQEQTRVAEYGEKLNATPTHTETKAKAQTRKPKAQPVATV